MSQDACPRPPAATPTPSAPRRSVFCKGMQPGRRVDAATLRLLLEAAAWAPSHGRSDPAHFVVFQSPQSERPPSPLLAPHRA